LTGRCCPEVGTEAKWKVGVTQLQPSKVTLNPDQGPLGDFFGMNSGKCDYKKRYEGYEGGGRGVVTGQGEGRATQGDAAGQRVLRARALPFSQWRPSFSPATRLRPRPIRHTAPPKTPADRPRPKNALKRLGGLRSGR
jgi:hypothetical protein